MRRLLHVAALPFPSPQGTQAAIDAMLRAECQPGSTPRLLTYAGHASTTDNTPYSIVRAPALTTPAEMRSGPSLRKLVNDAGLARAFRTAVRPAAEDPPQGVVAHHVEAALCCLRSPVPALFFAHTDLAAELPSYLPSYLPSSGRAALTPAATLAGHALDAALLRGYARIATVSPLLRDQLAARHPHVRARMRYVPLPWPLGAIRDPHRQAQARAALGLDADADVLAYTGNLDHYQGVDLLLAALSRLPPRARPWELLVATESDVRPLLRRAAQLGIGTRLRTAPLADETARVAAADAADYAVVPRRTPGGVPIKLLDALTRGLPTVAMPRATAGLPLGDCTLVAADDSVDALADAIDTARTTPTLAAVLGRTGRAYLRTQHGTPRYLRTIAELFDEIAEAATA